MMVPPRSGTIDILGVNIDSLSSEDLLRRAVDWACQDVKVTISYVNAHCLNMAVKDETYRQLLNGCDLVYSDGIGVVWAGHFLHHKKLYKVTGRLWIDEFCAMCQDKGISLYLLGGRPGVVQTTSQKLKDRFPSLKIAGMCDGFFHDMSEAQLLEDLESTKPDVLLVGMGVPLQEKWISAHRAHIPARVCWAVGALFDYTAGVEIPVPKLMERLALEWMWRMVVDPVGKWQRYMIGTPLFIYRVIQQKLSQG